jgi:hypothetical protein
MYLMEKNFICLMLGIKVECVYAGCVTGNFIVFSPNLFEVKQNFACGSHEVRREVEIQLASYSAVKYL